MGDIMISAMQDGTFTVKQGDKYAEFVTYDEMLGLISQLTMPEERHCKAWMRTQEEHQALRDSWIKKDD